LCRKGKAFCERAFALHRQQPENHKQNVDVPRRGKISADAHDTTHALQWLLGVPFKNKALSHYSGY